jgi:prepilin-type N-terminal cleavage/methylation domain
MIVPYRKSRGFTLVELATTVTLLGILLAIAIPSFRSLILNQGVKAAAFDLFSALQYARSEAIKRPGETVSLKAGDTTANNGQWSKGWRLLDGAGDNLRSWKVAANINVSDNSGGSVTTVTFGKDGHSSASPQLQVEPSSSVNGVGSGCVKVDLIGHPTSHAGNCP